MEKYKVYIYTCPCNLPTPFIAHNWIVIENNGQIERWEVGYMKNIGEENYGHLRKNLLIGSYNDGITIFPGLGLRWKGRVVCTIGGNEKSVAYQIIQYIISSPQNYPYKNNYSLLGPNSNTYVQWVISAFPDSGLYLPLNSLGRGFGNQ